MTDEAFLNSQIVFPKVRNHLIVCCLLSCALVMVGLAYLPHSGVANDPVWFLQVVSGFLCLVIIIEMYPLYVIYSQTTPLHYALGELFYTPKNLTQVIEGLLVFLLVLGGTVIVTAWENEFVGMACVAFGSLLAYRTSLYYWIETSLVKRKLRQSFENGE